ncbi:MAG: DNA primase [Chlamydiae bacterium]|nr:DNA primase [Chlamydiota bacterium]
MAMYTKESLETLKQKIDLVEIISSHVPLQRFGSSFKACCPFHDEKTPSFVVQRGDSHYHCFGCGAHGDAIAFYMHYLKMNFMESVEALAERFQVVLQEKEETHRQEKKALKEALHEASSFYHFFLLHTGEGQEALQYLYKRGVDLEFITLFEVGFASRKNGLFRTYMYQKGFDDTTMEEAGLIATGESGKKRDFFYDRITFPIRDAMGSVIGFSARKIREETFGGKYINTPETLLFKKSHTLFGLSYCRKRIVKERRALIVEGQIDALSLIQAGLTITVAGQGTAFGEGHVQELLHLGTKQVYLALDGDEAGQEAMSKIGHLFQKKGVEVLIVELTSGKDPDAFLKEEGEDAFVSLLQKSISYLDFFYKRLTKGHNLDSPAVKNEIVQIMTKKIKEWENPVMVYESLRKLAHIAEVPEALLGVHDQYSSSPMKRSQKVGFAEVDPDKILEGDLLRWLFLIGDSGARFVEMIKQNLKAEHFHLEVCRELFSFYLDCHNQNKPCDLLSFSIAIEKEEHRLFVAEILQKKINLQKPEEGLTQTIEKILQRNWMQEREEIKMKMYSGKCSDEEAIALAKQFDEIRKNPPKVQLT